MAKAQPIQHPNSNNDDDTPDDLDEDDDGEDDGKFESLLEKLVNPGAQKSGGETSMMMLMMMEQNRESRREAREARREARAEKDSMMKLILSMMQGANNKAMDPLMVEIIKASMSGKQQEEFTRTMMELQRNNSQQSMEMMRTTMEQAAALKDKMTEEVIETIRENAANKGAEPTSPAMEIFREIRLMAEPIIAAKMGAGATAKPETAASAGAGQKHIAAPNDNPKTQKELIPFILRALMHAQQNPNMTPAEKRSLRAKLSIVIMDVPELALAILDENEEKIALQCKEYVMADAVIFNWITKPDVAGWLNDYLKNQIAPMLDSMMEGEEKESGAVPANDEDDSPDSDADEKNTNPNDDKDA